MDLLKPLRTVKGFLLIELLVTMSILSFFLPLFCASVIQLQRHWTSLTTHIATYFTQRYITDFLYEDLSKVSVVLSSTATAIQVRTIDTTLITYSISQGRLGRKENNSPVTYLYTSQPGITKFELITTPVLSLTMHFNGQQPTTIIAFSQLGKTL